MSRALLALALLVPSLARATATPSVAVMPFKDLSGGKSKGSVGEAIRETVTSDLKDVPGMKVIERGNIDKVLAELSLQSSKSDLDPSSTVKVGKLLGATLLVAGAYQQQASNVRLTARFVKVETGEIVGTAKVDGPASDFLFLQDRVTVELLKSAGIESKHVQTFARRARPKLKNLKIVELYGDAVVQTDDTKKQTLLKQAVDEDPGFVYASRDLDELEKRMRSYSAAADRAQEQANRELAERLKREQDPGKVFTETLALANNLFGQRRYRQARAAFRALQTLKPPQYYEQMAEQAGQTIMKCDELLKDYDAALAEGEKFLKAHPTSQLFGVVQIEMNAYIETKRQIEEGKRGAADEIARLEPKDRHDPCKTGPIFQSHKQFVDSRRELEACLRTGSKTAAVEYLPLFLLVFATWEGGDFKACQQYLTQLRAKYPDQYRNVRQFESMLPVED
ncbi:MAG TPA: CsgG/HfaB family protein [Polyangia bacterium]|nr:CsgG/HfaB family protein [Polyangia bacterium]